MIKITTNINPQTKLQDLCLLGSHNAGTYGLTGEMGIAPDLIHLRGFLNSCTMTALKCLLIGFVIDWIIRKIVFRFSQTQTLDITNQLNLGVRFFDLRIGVDSEKNFRVCHGLYGPTIQEILRPIESFLDAHPQEVVLLDFQHLFEYNGDSMRAETTENLMKIVNEILKSKIADSSFGMDATLADLRSREKQVLIFCKKSDTDQDICWDRDQCMQSTWHNQPNWQGLEKALNSQIAANQKFFVVQAIITPNSDQQGCCSQIFSLIPSILSAAETVNERLLSWQRENPAKKCILMTDKVESLAQQIIPRFNRHLAHSN